MSLRPMNRKRTSVSGSLTGNLRRYKPLIALKSAVFAPIPSASEITTTAVQPLAWSSVRTAWRRSLIMSGEWTIDGRTWLGKKLRTVLSDIETVLEPDPEFAVDGDHRFVAEAHAGLERGLVAADEIGPLVAVEADAMAGAMRKARHFVVRPESGVGDDLSRSGVDRLARHA